MAEERSGIDELVDHLVNCTDTSAVIATHGPGESADDIVATMVAAGWTLDDRVDYVAGKRIRFLRPPFGGSTEPPFTVAEEVQG